MKKEIPQFKDEAQERAFWSRHDSSEFIDWSNAQRVNLPNLKPTMQAISLRLPKTMLDELRTLANKKDVPYQSLMKVFLSERIQEELKSRRPRAA